MVSFLIVFFLVLIKSFNDEVNQQNYYHEKKQYVNSEYEKRY